MDRDDQCITVGLVSGLVMPHPGLPHHWAIPGQAVASRERNDRRSAREQHDRSSRFRTRPAPQPANYGSPQHLAESSSSGIKDAASHTRRLPQPASCRSWHTSLRTQHRCRRAVNPRNGRQSAQKTTRPIQPTPHPQPDTPVGPRNQQLRGPQSQFFSRGVEVPISPAGPATPRHESWPNDAGCGHQPRSPSYRRPAGWPG